MLFVRVNYKTNTTISSRGDFLKGLQIIRKEKKLNQQKVAIDLNISREALSNYENGKRQPDIETLKKLSEYFNVSIDFLINGDEFKKKWEIRKFKHLNNLEKDVPLT